MITTIGNTSEILLRN